MKNIFKLLLIIVFIFPIGVFAYDKSEVIYTNLDTNGKEVKKIVNNELKISYEGKVEDNSILKDIKNINGKEKFDKSNNMLTWKSKGRNIFYQGTINKENPIIVDISYYLDDKKISYKKLKNKSGNVKIIYKFNNNLYNYEYNLHTPFVVNLDGLLTGDNISDIEVSNGKGINTGNRYLISAIALPGLSNDLDINDINTDEITISFYTKKFKGIGMYIFANPKLLEKSDIDFNNLDSLDKSMNDLQNGVNKLESGSNELTDGINKYTGGVGSIAGGSNKLLNGILSALDGAKKIENGNSHVNTNLEKIIAGLKAGEEELKAKSEELNVQIAKIQDLKTANTSTIDKLTNGNNLLVQGVLNQTSNMINISTMTRDQVLTTLNALVDAGQMSEESKNSILSYKDSYDNNVGLITLITTNNNTIDLLVTSLTNSSTSIATELSTIDGYLTKLQTEGTSKLSSGSSDLREGLETLYDGSTTLVNGINTLNNRSSKLTGGSSMISEGISKLNNEGISKLTRIYKIISSKKDKVKLLTELSREYNGFSSNNSTNTTFVYKVNY